MQDDANAEEAAMNSVDVVVPCYNYARYLEYCVNSVLSQRDVVVRVLIIDDKSSDETPAIGERLASQDPRVTFRRHAVNRGLIGTANEGVLDWASAPFTLLLSADDALAPGALARAVHVLDAHPDAGMVYGMAQVIGEDEVPLEEADSIIPTYRLVDGPRFLRFSCLCGNPIATPTAVVRTKFQQRTGGYSPKLRHTSDMEMWMRIARFHSIAVIRQTQGYYRKHRSNMSEQYMRGMLGDLPERALTCDYVYSNWNGAEVPGFADWISEMRSEYTKQALRAASAAIEHKDWDFYQECLGFASKMSPYWRVSPMALRLYARPFLKSAAGQHLKGLLKGLRGKPAETAVSDWSLGSKVGWWPDLEPAEQSTAQQR
jgi:glycosyltransferase involved in cell wall biosynthesis